MLEPGTKVIITDTKGHHFKKGTICEILGIYANGYYGLSGPYTYNRREITLTQSVNEKSFKIIKNEKDMVTKLDVLYAANQLCIANNTVTTLEIKNFLRKKFPNKRCTQDFVSKTMIDYANEGRFTFNDNGTYRVYSSKLSGTVQAGSAITVSNSQTSKTNKNMNTKRISRTTAINLMRNSKGQFFTVEFQKQDGTLRTLNGQYMKDQKLNSSYVLVKESGKLKTGSNPIRNVNPDTLKVLKIGGETYRIRK